MSEKYTQDGVDVSEGDSFSAAAARVCRNSRGNSRFVEVIDFSTGHFRGPRGFRLRNLPDGCSMNLAPDGVGTKTIIIDAASTHARASQDLVAMCCGDITRWGGLPILFTNVLDVATLGKHRPDALRHERNINKSFRVMMEGLGKVAREQNIVVFNGETAELGICVGSENPEALTMFNWAGTAFGVYHPDKMITGDRLKPGLDVIALREYGFRSNGISSVRKAFNEKFGRDWYIHPSASRAIRDAAKSSVLYDKMFTYANGWYGTGRLDIQLIVHVTGGAIRSKFAEDILFPRGLSADLDDLWEPPMIMKDCAICRGLNGAECYETWNCGQGALVVTEPQNSLALILHAASHHIEAKVCGRIVSSQRPFLRIKSRFEAEVDIVFHSTVSTTPPLR